MTDRRYFSLLILLVLFLIQLCASAGAQALEKEADPQTIAIITSGTGKDEDAALRQAYSNAIQQAVGTIVDAETVVADDAVIKDKVLTASNAIVEGYDQVGKPLIENGLVTVKIKARVLRKQLTDRLAAANVVSRNVEGKDVAAQLETDLAREKDAAAIVRRCFKDFPGNVLKAESVGKPRIIKKDVDEATVGVTVQFTYDIKKYQQWYSQVTPYLAKIAAEKRDIRWNPAASFDQFIKPAKDSTRVEILKKNVTADALRSSVEMGIRWIGWLPRGLDDSMRTSLTIFERAGSTRGLLLHLDESTYKELMRATCAIPVVEVVLVGNDSTEIDGQMAVSGFGPHSLPATDVAYYTAPFFTVGGESIMPSGFYDQPISPDWKPDSNRLSRHEGVVVAPYIGGSYGNDSAYIVTAINVEFPFKLNADQLQSLKKIEVRMSSRNNSPPEEP